MVSSALVACASFIRNSLILTAFGIPATGVVSSDASANTMIVENVPRYYSPSRGSNERKEIMNAARQPVSAEIGQQIIFVVDVLRSDGNVAYLQAVPHRTDGTKIDWTKTPFREAWMQDAMSDVVMVLLSRVGNRWTVVDFVVGPTDVHWYGWLDRYGLPETLFYPGR